MRSQSHLTYCCNFLQLTSHAESVKKASKPESEQSPGKVRSVGHVINKITLVPKSAVALVSWAMSPRLRSNFDYDIELQFLGGMSMLTVSDPVLQDCRNTLRRLSGISTTAFDEAVARHLSFLKERLRPKRHAECVLILYLFQPSAGMPPSPVCTYIGISKLSCLCCTKFIEVFNAHRKLRLTTSGSYHKLYPWGILGPDDSITPELRAVLKDVHTEVRATFQGRCLVKYQHGDAPISGLSDSIASTAGGNFEVDDAPPDGYNGLIQTFLP